MTKIKVKGHQQKYMCVELHGGYNHTKFDYARYHSLRKSPNVKVSDKISVQVNYFPECKIVKQNWYTRHTLDVLYIHTKFHLDDMSSSRDNETAHFAHKANPAT